MENDRKDSEMTFTISETNSNFKEFRKMEHGEEDQISSSINLRWIDGPEKDLLVLRTTNWRTLAGRRLAWKRLLEKAKAHPGLSCH
ncbi:hypothetical protein TNCV_4955081 [Trichonephila clavipes]|nr:hypothetical protein TNCV_4955081 [Trichonephila clavipes]